MKVTTTAVIGVLAAAFAGTLTTEVRLNGTTQSGWSNLDDPGDDRERGKTDVYDFRLSELGPLTSFDIAFDDKGDSSHWCLEEVVVRGPRGVTVHPHHTWLRSATTKANPLRLGAA